MGSPASRGILNCMPARDPREHFVTESLRCFGHGSIAGGGCPGSPRLLVASIAMPSSGPLREAGLEPRGQSAARRAGVHQLFFSYLLCRRSLSDAQAVDDPVARDNAPPNDAIARPFLALRFLHPPRLRQAPLAQRAPRSSITPLPSRLRCRSLAANPLCMRPRGTKSRASTEASTRGSPHWKRSSERGSPTCSSR